MSTACSAIGRSSWRRSHEAIAHEFEIAGRALPQPQPTTGRRRGRRVRNPWGIRRPRSSLRRSSRSVCLPGAPLVRQLRRRSDVCSRRSLPVRLARLLSRLRGRRLRDGCANERGGGVVGAHFKHHHVWGVSGKCEKSNANCDATRCAATVVQFRRGQPHEMRCKARAFTKAGLCMRCDEMQRRLAHEEASA